MGAMCATENTQNPFHVLCVVKQDKAAGEDGGEASSSRGIVVVIVAASSSSLPSIVLATSRRSRCRSPSAAVLFLSPVVRAAGCRLRLADHLPPRRESPGAFDDDDPRWPRHGGRASPPYVPAVSSPSPSSCRRRCRAAAAKRRRCSRRRARATTVELGEGDSEERASTAATATPKSSTSSSSRRSKVKSVLSSAAQRLESFKDKRSSRSARGTSMGPAKTRLPRSWKCCTTRPSTACTRPQWGGPTLNTLRRRPSTAPTRTATTVPTRGPPLPASRWGPLLSKRRSSGTTPPLLRLRLRWCRCRCPRPFASTCPRPRRLRRCCTCE